ncbi:unnamed protein product [Ectocarpus sp. 13 AM-2016]
MSCPRVLHGPCCVTLQQCFADLCEAPSARTTRPTATRWAAGIWALCISNAPAASTLRRSSVWKR